MTEGPANGNHHGPTNGNGRDPRLIEGFLPNVPLFRGMGQRRISDIAARARALHFRRGAVVCEQAVVVPGLFAIAYGQVKLAFRSEGEERITRIAAATNTFGLAPAILGRPAPYEAVALDDTLVILIPAAVVLQIVDNDPRFARAVIEELAERTLGLLAEVESGSLHSSVHRLAAYLERLAGEPGNETCTVHLPTTKTVVAARLGIKKETLSRLLRVLAQQGLIKVAQRNISILDRARLTVLARETH